MDFDSLTNDQLWKQAGSKVADERGCMVDTLLYLCEIQKRHLFAEYGHSSLWAALTKHFKYDGGSAQRRVDVIAILRTRPELADKLRSGELNLTNLSAVQVCINNHAMSVELQDELLKSVENKSTREAQREIAKVVPKALPGDRERPLDATHTLGTYVLDNETLELLARVKNELSHIDSNPSMNDLLKRVAKIALEKVSKTRQPKRRRKQPPAPVVRPLTVAQKRAVFVLYDNKCCEPGCESSHHLEVDHIVPRAFGGTNEPENLRLLCRTHNLMHARRWFGAEKIESYMRR